MIRFDEVGEIRGWKTNKGKFIHSPYTYIGADNWYSHLFDTIPNMMNKVRSLYSEDMTEWMFIKRTNQALIVSFNKNFTRVY